MDVEVVVKVMDSLQWGRYGLTMTHLPDLATHSSTAYLSLQGRAGHFTCLPEQVLIYCIELSLSYTGMLSDPVHQHLTPQDTHSHVVQHHPKRNIFIDASLPR